jgi:hypothetical protein
MQNEKVKMMRRYRPHRAWLFGYATLFFASFSRADELRLDARRLFAESVSQHLRLSADGQSIELDRGELFEDDGPAAGFSFQPNEETLTPDVRLRKTLIVPDPKCSRATLLVGTRSEDLRFEINGSPADAKHVGKEGNYWRKFELDPKLLTAGENEIVVRGTGKVWIARDDEYAAGSLERTRHPNRSAKSLDRGATWSDAKLGTKGDIDGEYYVRLFLDRFQASGSLTTPVIDVGNLAERDIPSVIASVDDVGEIRIDTGYDPPPKTTLVTQTRRGTTPTLDTANWSPWSDPNPKGVPIDRSAGRYLQFRVILATDDLLATPKLSSVTISRKSSDGEDWTRALKVVESCNPPVVRSSIPFDYEPFDRPELAALRRDYKLDEVVAGSKSEWEFIQRLSAWSSSRWQKGHLGKIYPKWNAHEILKPYDDGTPVGGFCQHYNLVFLQACESFGLVGRGVSLGQGNYTDKIRGGHETVEIWSNDFNKWVFIDGDKAMYFVDAAGPKVDGLEVPLSHWELRERQVAAFAGKPHAEVAMRKTAERDQKWDGLTSFPPFLELRLIPRSNFLEAAAPLPLNQGMRGWFWTGHYVWTDDAFPAGMLYSERVTRRGNFEWTPNRTHVTFEPLVTPGEMRVHLDTVTPGFREFHATIADTSRGLRSINAADGGERRIETGHIWKLHPGTNRLAVRARNTTGRDGPAAMFEIVRGE